MRRPDTPARESEDLPASKRSSPSREGRGLSKPPNLRYRGNPKDRDSAAALQLALNSSPLDPIWQSEPEKQTMRQKKPSQRTAAFVISLAVASTTTIAPLAGCDRSTTEIEIPEQAKKAIIQRKVDVTPGKARSSRTGGPPAKGRATGR